VKNSDVGAAQPDALDIHDRLARAGLGGLIHEYLQVA
jgi:hypothetical protein